MINLIQISATDSTNIFVLQLLTFIFGGGVGGVIIRYILEWRRKNRSFDIRMNELLQQNKFRGRGEIVYVPRTSLEEAFKEFLKSDRKICKISGPAGSGKTRFALNITCKSSLFSKYFPVYVDKNSAKIFSPDFLSSLNSIQGRRRYVFIFDYVYENRGTIGNLLKLTGKTRRHKYVFIERDYNYWEFNNFFDERDFMISMESHKMNQNMLSNVFINSLPYTKRKLPKVREDALEIITSITEKIDPDLNRPIFAKIAAEIYNSNTKCDFRSIRDVEEILSLYWNNKFSKDRVQVICARSNIIVDEFFMIQLEILLRVLLLIAAITRNKITITKNPQLSIKIKENDIHDIIIVCCNLEFLNSIDKLSMEELRQLFGVALKEHVKISNERRENKFEIVSELDIISEWIFLDSVKVGDKWIQQLETFFRLNFKNDFVNFLGRGSLDFYSLVEHLQHSAWEDLDGNEYYALLVLLIHQVYKEDNYSLENKYKELILYMLERAKVSFAFNEFALLQKNTLIEIRESYNDFKHKRELTEKILDFFEK